MKRSASFSLSSIVGAAALLFAALAPAATPQGEAAPTDRFDSLAGRLLVAEAGMRDPRFRHAVIYMVRHGPDGAFGVIVNKPLGAMPWPKLFEGLDLEEAAPEDPVAVYFGGPVERRQGFVLHSRDYAVDGTFAVDAGFALTQNAAILRDIAAGRGPEQGIILFGYAGWGPGQLEGEMTRGSWFTVDADVELVFGADNAGKWPAARRRRGVDL